MAILSPAQINHRVDTVCDFYKRGSRRSSICTFEAFLMNSHAFDARFMSIFKNTPPLSKTLISLEKEEPIARCFLSSKSSRHFIAINPKLFESNFKQLSKFILFHETFHIIKFLKSKSLFASISSMFGFRPQNHYKEEIDADRFACEHANLSELASALDYRLRDEDIHSLDRVKVIAEKLAPKVSAFKAAFIITRSIGKELKSVEGILKLAHEKVQKAQHQRCLKLKP